MSQYHPPYSKTIVSTVCYLATHLGQPSWAAILLILCADDIQREFEKYGLNNIKQSKFSLSKIMRVDQEKSRMMRSTAYATITQPLGYLKMRKYGGTDDW